MSCLFFLLEASGRLRFCIYPSPPAVYVENEGGNPPIFPFVLHFLSLFVHYFLENVTTEPPITPKRGISALGSAAARARARQGPKEITIPPFGLMGGSLVTFSKK